MFLLIDSWIREQIFEPAYAWGYKHSGNTQYNFAAYLFGLALICYVVAFVMSAAHGISEVLLSLAGFILVVIWGRALTQLREQSEKGWDERKEDHSGDMYRTWLPWGMLRMTFMLASLVEAALAVLQGQSSILHSELYYAAMFALIVGSLYFSSCNRSFYETRQVIP